jgi:hypothetical protein
VSRLIHFNSGLSAHIDEAYYVCHGLKSVLPHQLLAEVQIMIASTTIPDNGRYPSNVLAVA